MDTPNEEEASPPPPSSPPPVALVIVLTTILASYLASSILPKVGLLPPPVVILRKLRPPAKIAVVIFWACYRSVWGWGESPSDLAAQAKLRAQTLDGQEGRWWLTTATTGCDGVHGGGCGGGGGGAGLFDIWSCLIRNTTQQLLHRLSTEPNPWWGAGLVNSVLSTLTLLLNDILGLLLLHTILSNVSTLLFHTTITELKDAFIQSTYEFASEYVPFVKAELAREETKMLATIEASLKDPDRTVTRTLPTVGCDSGKLIEQLQKRSAVENAKWQDGLVSGTVYSGEPDHTTLLNAVYASYSLSNPLHPDVWPSVIQMEAEVISMTASILNGGDDGVVGATTSGGTESIIMAVRSAVEYYGRRRGITSHQAEIVACTTAHAGLNKACEMFGVRLVSLPPHGTTFVLDPRNVERAVTCNTVLIYASAPSFAQGVIDPIAELSDVARRYDVGLHVDACLGGFVLPFAKKLGYAVPTFDFACPGVTSMSVDTHKYGYATKGTSVVLYRHGALRQAQYFAYPKWTGGLYATPTIAGSRSGALLACAWASLVCLGESGFTFRVERIMECTRTIADGVSKIPGLDLMGGRPRAMVVCFGSSEFDIYRVGDAMSKRGWSLNVLQRPACVHLCVTLQTVPHADKFLAELESVVKEIREEGDNGNGKKEFNAAVYGLAGSLPPGPVATLLKCYTDATLTP